MYPISTVDKISCMQALVGIRTACDPGTNYPFWIEDIEGVDVSKLAKIAKSSNPSGKDFANQLINNASRQMMGDLELFLNDGYRLNNVVGDMCSTCTLLPTYVVNTGIVVKSSVATNFNILRITKLQILANNTGTFQMVIDDGETPEYFDIELTAGTIMPVVLNYFTKKKSAKVYFSDPIVSLGQVMCSTSSSCGCGGSATSNNPITVTGLVAGVESSTQYGFLPCAAVGCSYDSLVCGLVKQAPNIFGLALLYKVGALYYDNKRVGDRNNDAISFNDEEGTEKEDQKKNYDRLYWAKMKGTTSVLGINKVVKDYLKNNRTDKCVICDSKLLTAYATG